MRRSEKDRKHTDGNYKFQLDFFGKEIRAGKTRFRKVHPLDCGNKQCRICHSDKYPTRKLTKKENEQREDYEEYMRSRNDG